MSKCSTVYVANKNNALSMLDALKYPGADNTTCQTDSLELQVKSKQTEWSPGQLPTGGVFEEMKAKIPKGAVTWWGAAVVGVGAIILFYFAIRMKWIKL